MKLRPNTAPNRPWYLPRSAGVKRSPITASEIGNRAPAPRPWRPRKRISSVDVLGQPGQRRADQEDHDADHQHRLPAVQVGQLAVEGHRDRAGQQVDRDRPDVQGLAAELGDDGRQGNADDGLVERAEEQPEQDRAQDLELGPLGLKPSAGSSAIEGA